MAKTFCAWRVLARAVRFAARCSATRAIPNLAKRCSNGQRSPATPELWRADPDAFLELPPLMPSAHAVRCENTKAAGQFRR
jgi:hypothetical protein